MSWAGGDTLPSNIFSWTHSAEAQPVYEIVQRATDISTQMPMVLIQRQHQASVRGVFRLTVPFRIDPGMDLCSATDAFAIWVMR